MFIRSTAALGLTALSALPATAQDLLDARDTDRIARLLQSEGYPSEVTVDGIGDPMIKSKAAGSEFNVYFYDCTDHTNCLTLQLNSGYNLTDGMTLERANQWNAENRYALVYLDEEMDPYLKMDMNIDYGVTDENFVDNLKLWSSLMRDFEKFIDW